MNDQHATKYGDPVNAAFWEAASREELVIQQCTDCGSYQFYGRPFCLACQSDHVEWVETGGFATVYSLTRVELSFDPAAKTPYLVAVVELDEGPRMMTNIVNGNAEIGDRVRVTWRHREDAPPLPVFQPALETN